MMVNTLWVLVAACLVLFMNAGFAMLESGLCRSNNTVNILGKNFIVFGISMIGFWAIGYERMFGGAGKFVGSEGWFLDGLAEWVTSCRPASQPLLVCGDVNIALEDRDVHLK